MQPGSSRFVRFVAGLHLLAGLQSLSGSAQAVMMLPFLGSYSVRSGGTAVPLLASIAFSLFTSAWLLGLGVWCWRGARRWATVLAWTHLVVLGIAVATLVHGAQAYVQLPQGLSTPGMDPIVPLILLGGGAAQALFALLSLAAAWTGRRRPAAPATPAPEQREAA